MRRVSCTKATRRCPGSMPSPTRRSFLMTSPFSAGEIVGGPMHLRCGGKPADRGRCRSHSRRREGGRHQGAAHRICRRNSIGEQMQRWGISEAACRRGARSTFANRVWGRSTSCRFSGSSLRFSLQSGLISWLIYEHRRRWLAEVRSRNAMAELANMNRLATAGELSASIAHEINQPMTGIVLRASAALRWLPEDMPNAQKVRGVLTEIVGAGERATEIITSVRAMFNKDSRAKVVPINLNNLINTVWCYCVSICKRMA